MHLPLPTLQTISFRVKVTVVVPHVNKKQAGTLPLILQATSVLGNKKHDAALNITARHIIQQEIRMKNYIFDCTNGHQFSSFVSWNKVTRTRDGKLMKLSHVFFRSPEAKLQVKKAIEGGWNG